MKGPSHFSTGWVFILFSACVVASSLKDETELRNSLFSDYSPNPRPVYNHSTVTYVNISFNLQSVQNLDPKTQVLKTAGYMNIVWMDELLKWRPEKYGGLTSIVVKPDQIWMPDLVLDNGANGLVRLGKEEFLATLEYTGLVIWVPGDVYKTQCLIDVTFYPFDRQTCFINITSWVYPGGVLQLTTEPSINLISYVQNGEFNLKESTASEKTELYNNISYCFVVFRLVLKRRCLFYVINTILPVLFLSTLNALVFIVPPEAGEKMSLSITVLLAYAVFLSIVNADMPDTSLSVSLLSVYILMVLAVGTASIVLSAIVLHLYYKVPNTRDLLPCLKRLPKTTSKPELPPTDYQEKKKATSSQGASDGGDSDPCKTGRVPGTTSSVQDGRYYKELVNRIDMVSLWLILGLTLFGFLLVVIVLITGD